ncbi:MAG: thioredoxin-disulfide reductase [Nanoarchaeota archaeon]
MRNVIILGSGMAGLTAAIYAARDSLYPLVISGYEPGGQITYTTDVENFPGFPDGIKGPDLAEAMRKQAERFGAEFKEGIISQFAKSGQGYTVRVGEETIQTKTIIIATGAKSRMLGLPAEEKYIGRGVHTCATCDGFFYKGKNIAVIGGGDSAAEEAGFLTTFADKVTIIHRREELRASKIMQERIKANPKIAFLWNSTVAGIKGDAKHVTHLVVKDTVSGKEQDMAFDAMFLAIGHSPNTDFLKGHITLDEKGYVKADNHTKTSLPGVFAAGDVQDARYRQAVTAAGSGCMAAIEVRHYLQENRL